MSESQTALIFNLKFANFQGNSEARRTEIIQKREIGFLDNKNLSSLPICDDNI